MRILISLSYYFPNISGLTLYVKNLAEEFAKKNQVTILTSQHSKILKRQEDINSVNIVRVPVAFQFGKALGMPFYFYYAWKEALVNDVIFINLPQFEGFVLAFIAKILHKRIYCIYHCEVTLPKGLLNKISEYALHAANYLSLIFSHKIIAYTQDYAEHSKLLPLFRKKLLFIYPLIKTPEKPKILPVRLQNYPESKKKIKFIGIAARVSAEKGIEYLFKAVPILQKELRENFIILIAGSKQPVGEGSYIKRLNSLVRQYHKHIHFLDTVPYEQLGSFYSLLDILVLPSINSTESFGIVQVEAMLCGIPVIATDLPGVRVPIQKTGMGKIVPIKNTHELAKSIVEVLKNKEKFIKKKEEIKKEFSYEKTMEFYQNLLN